MSQIALDASTAYDCCVACLLSTNNPPCGATSFFGGGGVQACTCMGVADTICMLGHPVIGVSGGFYFFGTTVRNSNCGGVEVGAAGL